jgi:predicted nucleic acid-binding protein
MMKSYFLDTNVLIYLLDSAEPEKQRSATEWVAALSALEAAIVSPQTVLEFCHVVRRKFARLPRGPVESYLDVMRPWCLAPANFDVYHRGLALHFETGYQVPDCTMLASALAAGCEIFLTEDLQSGREIDGMLIVNPFMTGCKGFLANN